MTASDLVPAEDLEGPPSPGAMSSLARTSPLRAFLGERPALTQAVAMVVGLRFSLGVIAYVGDKLYPRDWNSLIGLPYSQYLVPESSKLWPFVGPWQRWDAGWFELIARGGYQHHGPDAAFEPGFPVAMRVLGHVFGSYPVAGLLIATVAMVVALYLLHLLIVADFGNEVASRTVVYLGLAPTAFFLLAPYSDALFLALSVGTFLAARRRRWVIAGVLAGLAILTRAQGALLIAVLVVEVVLAARARHRCGERTMDVGMALAVAVPTATAVGYYLWLRFHLGFSGGSLQVEEIYWRSTFGNPLQTLLDSITVVRTSLWTHPFEALNLAAAGALTLSVPVMAVLEFPPSYTVYALLSAAAMFWRESAFTPLLSADRFVVVVFPLFLLLALAGRRAWVDRLVLAVFAPLLGFLLFHFAQGQFVG